MFDDKRPAMITSPRVRAATVEPIVAVPSEITAVSRIPPRITGRASGRSTCHSRWRWVRPMPRAASATLAGWVVRPARVFSNTGSRP